MAMNLSKLSWNKLWLAVNLFCSRCSPKPE
jgi:hypothetical protein